MSVVSKQQQKFTLTVINQYIYMISVINSSNTFLPLIELFGMYMLFILLLVKTHKTCYFFGYAALLVVDSARVLNYSALCLSIHLLKFSNFTKQLKTV